MEQKKEPTLEDLLAAASQPAPAEPEKEERQLTETERWLEQSGIKPGSKSVPLAMLRAAYDITTDTPDSELKWLNIIKSKFEHNNFSVFLDEASFAPHKEALFKYSRYRRHGRIKRKAKKAN